MNDNPGQSTAVTSRTLRATIEFTRQEDFDEFMAEHRDSRCSDLADWNAYRVVEPSDGCIRCGTRWSGGDRLPCPECADQSLASGERLGSAVEASPLASGSALPECQPVSPRTGQESGGARLIRGTHPYMFRAGQWGELLGEIDHRDGHRCYLVRFPDGVSDFWPVHDTAAGYEFRGGLA